MFRSIAGYIPMFLLIGGLAGQSTLNLDLTGMTPHVGQLFELRVVDQSDGSEIGRTRVASIAAADFSVSVPGLAIGGSYDVDFYADLNGNGVYVAPGDDHAWQINYGYTGGCAVPDLARNTNFTNIGWPGSVAILSDTDGPPETFALQRNYPNLFSPSTRIRYDLHRAVQAMATIYYILGRQVNTLVDELPVAGSYAVHWNGRDRQG